MRRLGFTSLSIGFILVFAAALFAAPSTAESAKLKRFEKPTDPINHIFRLIRQKKFAETEKFFAGIGLSTGGQVQSLWTNWVADGEIDKVDLLKLERLGSTLRRYYYVIRRDPIAYMFAVFYVIEAEDGWILYNFNFNTAMKRFFPDWKDPN